jgi:hypothetical protein
VARSQVKVQLAVVLPMPLLQKLCFGTDSLSEFGCCWKLLSSTLSSFSTGCFLYSPVLLRLHRINVINPSLF